MLITNATGNTLQSIKISLDEQQLTDQISFVTTVPVTILQQVLGQYLDYPFFVSIEQITQTGILFDCQCCTTIDELLFTPINYEISESDRQKVKTGNLEVESGTIDRDGLQPWGQRVHLTLGEAEQLAEEEVEACLASTHVDYICNALGITAVQRYEDFFSSMALEQKDVTYNDLISTLFGWTSRIETQMINAYIRNNVLYIIQRGYEANIIDLSNTKFTTPVITRQLIRKTWATQDDNTFTLHTRTGGGTAYASRGSLAHKLFVGQDDDTTYSYDDDGLVQTSTTTSADGTKTETVYEYKLHKGYKYLAREETTTTDADGEKTTRKTVHTPLGNGQMETRVYEDGEFVSSVIGPGIKNSEPSNKTLKDESADDVKVGEAGGEQSEEEVTVEGNPMIDPSFPVYNKSKLEELTAALKDMNRKTQETVSMDIFNYEHVIDFNDRIIFLGAPYFLKSNKVEKSVPNRIANKQSVQLVRWY